MKVLMHGAEPEEAKLIVILLHGRGASGDDIMGLSQEIEGDDICWLAPTALNNAWYPARFMERRAANEPFLTLSTEQVKGLIAEFPIEKVILGGFSQGACLTADILARHPMPLAGAWLFSGGLIGTDEELPAVTQAYQGLPVTLSGSLQDPHIPAERMKRTAQHLGQMGARVETLHYDFPSHQIAAEEVELAQQVLQQVRARLDGRT
ncbi:MAG: phospholipase [Vulcanimicrobiota bacterium]